MFIGKVAGHLVTTQKEPPMADAKLLLIEAYSGAGAGAKELKPTGKMLVAVDFLGAGRGEYVMITQGSSARMTERTRSMPVDAIVVGIVDSVSLHDQILQRGDGSLGD